MKNYAMLWKDDVNFQQIKYDDFVTTFETLPNTFYLEKVDGQLGMLMYKRGETPTFQSSHAIETADLPVLYEYQTILQKLKVDECILAGELVAKKSGTILPFNQTESIVKKSRIDSNKPLIHHYLYDVYMLNGKRVSFNEAMTFVQKYFKPASSHIHIPKIEFGGLEKFRKLFNETEDKPGIEGVVVRDLHGKNYKVKRSETVDLVVIGAGQVGLPAWNKDQVSYLLTSFIDKNGNFRTSSKVGTGMTHQLRSWFYKYVKKNAIYDQNGEFFVPPKLVIEVKAFRHRITPTPTYSLKQGRYEKIGDENSITFSHPSFERMRPDKQPDKKDVRLEQISDWKY